MKRSGVRATLAAVTVLAATVASRAEQSSWPDTSVSRLEALAVLETLNADLLSHDSATLTLDRWCADHKLADPARIVAERVKDADQAPSADTRERLSVTATEPVRYRRVRLTCGSHVLSEADNFYVPSRLTAEMNRTLETTDTAFGRAVQSLHFRRHTVSAQLLWQPLPPGWDMAASPPLPAARALDLPDHLLQHRAVLTLPDGTPFSEVVETYTSAVLAFPAPSLPR